MRTRFVRALAATVLLTGTAISGPALGAESPAGDDKIVFRVGVTEDMITMSPFKAYGIEFETFFLVYDMLFNFGQKDVTPVPGLATAVPDGPSSPDGKTWTFKIRPGVKWSDGEPLTAHDIAFTYNFILKNDIGIYVTYLPYTQSITAPDDTTLVWKTTRQTIAPLSPPWIPIVPEHIWSGFNATEAKDFKNVPTVGSGPFRLVSWDKGEGWTLVANEDYWGGAPNIDEIHFRVFQNTEAMVLALKEGSIDFADAIPPSLFNTLKGQDNVTTHPGTALFYRNLVMNQVKEGSEIPACDDSKTPETEPCNSTGHPALLDERVRLAIAHAVDRRGLVDKVLQGNGSVGSSVQLPTGLMAWQPAENEIIGHDVAEAKRILDDAGYADTDGNGIREMPGGGEPLEFDLYVLGGTASSYEAGPLIKGYLKQIGMDVRVHAVSSGKLLDLWGGNDYDMYIWGYYPTPDPDYILSTFTTGQCLNLSDSCFSDPTYDAMYEEQRSATDPEERRRIVIEMQKYLYEKNPELVLWYEQDLQAWRNDHFTGYLKQPEPLGSPIMSYGPYSYMNIRPVSSGGPERPSGGVSGTVWLVIVAGLVIVVVGVVLFRRRVGVEERH